MSLIALILAVSSAPAAPADDPLAPARAGQVQCYTPNAAGKTCQSIGGYRFEAGGEILNDAEIMLQASPLVVIRTSAPVTVRGGEVCGRMTGNEPLAVLVEGAPADAATADLVRSKYLEAMQPFFGRDVCTRFGPGEGPGTATVDGKSVPEMTQTVRWVDPAEGWRVAP